MDLAVLSFFWSDRCPQEKSWLQLSWERTWRRILRWPVFPLSHVDCCNACMCRTLWTSAHKRVIIIIYSLSFLIFPLLHVGCCIAYMCRTLWTSACKRVIIIIYSLLFLIFPLLHVGCCTAYMCRRLWTSGSINVSKGMVVGEALVSLKLNLYLIGQNLGGKSAENMACCRQFSPPE